MPLPILQTYYAENANYCGYLVPFTSPFATVAWYTAGRSTTYRVTPLPMAICDGCIPVYTVGVNVPDPSASFAFTPLYWFTLQGAVTSPATSSGSSAPISGVAVTAVIVNVADGSPFIPAPGAAPITDTAVTDITGSFSIQLASALLTAQYYTVALTPSRTDTSIDSQQSIITLSSTPLYSFSRSNEDNVVAFILGVITPVYALSFAVDPLLLMNQQAQATGGAPVQGPLSYSWLSSDSQDSSVVSPYHQGIAAVTGSYIDLLASQTATSAGAVWQSQWGGVDTVDHGVAGWTFELVFKLARQCPGRSCWMSAPRPA